MNALGTALPLAWAYLRARPLATVLNIALLALGIATIVALALTLSQLEERMDRDAAGIDLVIGAKGSPLQLILSTVFQVDIPTGNIDLAEAERLTKHAHVKQAIPLALGDSYKTFRIVGTDARYLTLYAATLHDGRGWQAPQEVVLGALVARITGLKVGDKFTGSHGLTEGGGHHDEHPYTVVGILKSSGAVIDRVILTSVESIWEVHEHEEGEGAGAIAKAEKQITAVLIQYATPLAAASFPRRVNASSGLQAAAPAMETARLFNLLGVGISALKGFAVVLMLCAALGIFVGLMNALDEHRADLALLRLLGASPATVFLTIMAQGVVLGLAGVILGTLIGHIGAEWVGLALEKTHRVALSGGIVISEELWVGLGAMAMALLAGLFPAWRAYRNAVPESLSRN